MRRYELRNKKNGYTIEWNIPTLERAIELRKMYEQFGDKYDIIIRESEV